MSENTRDIERRIVLAIEQIRLKQKHGVISKDQANKRIKRLKLLLERIRG